MVILYFSFVKSGNPIPATAFIMRLGCVYVGDRDCSNSSASGFSSSPSLCWVPLSPPQAALLGEVPFCFILFFALFKKNFFYVISTPNMGIKLTMLRSGVTCSDYRASLASWVRFLLRRFQTVFPLLEPYLVHGNCAPLPHCPPEQGNTVQCHLAFWDQSTPFLKPLQV